MQGRLGMPACILQQLVNRGALHLHILRTKLHRPGYQSTQKDHLGAEVSQLSGFLKRQLIHGLCAFHDARV